MTSIVKHPATAAPRTESTVEKESALKSEPPTVEQPKAQGEAEVSADPPKAKSDPTGQLPPPKAKDEAVTQQSEAAVQEVPKAKPEATLQQQQPKVEGKVMEKVGQPKAGGQSQSLLSIAGIKGALGFGPSKPERPPPVSQGDGMTQIEQDEEADFNAAVQASLQTPTSPPMQSGAQSSTPRPTSLDDRESELNAQLDKLSAEALRVEVITNPSIRDKSRIRTIEGVTQEIVSQLEEIAQQRLRATSSAVVSQSTTAQSAKPIAAPGGKWSQNLQRRENELHVRSVLERKRRRNDLLQHPGIVLYRKDNVLRPQLRIGLIEVKEDLNPLGGIVILWSVVIPQHQLENLAMIEGDALQHRNMIGCQRKGDALHPHQGNIPGIEGEEGILRNKVRFLGKRGDGHHHLRWHRSLQRFRPRNLRSWKRKKRRPPKVEGGLRQLKLLMMNQ